MLIPVSMEMMLLAGTAPLLAGLVLVKMGLRPRRRGHAPHCPTCDYNLTGLSSERCPECGTPITAATTVYGERTRRPLTMAIGLFCSAAGLVWMIGAGRQIDWYRHAPTFLVIHALDSPDTTRAARAWAEIKRREVALSESQRNALIDMGIAQQASNAPCPAQQQFIQFVTRRCFRDQLSESQKATFFDQMVRLELAVPPKIVRGQRVDYQFNYDLRGPSRYSDDYLNISIIHGEVQLDGQVLYKESTYSTAFNNADMRGTSAGRSIGRHEPGPHELIIKPKVRIRRRNPEGGLEVIYERQLELKRTFVVLEAE